MPLRSPLSNFLLFLSFRFLFCPVQAPPSSGKSFCCRRRTPTSTSKSPFPYWTKFYYINYLWYVGGDQCRKNICVLIRRFPGRCIEQDPPSGENTWMNKPSLTHTIHRQPSTRYALAAPPTSSSPSHSTSLWLQRPQSWPSQPSFLDGPA